MLRMCPLFEAEKPVLPCWSLTGSPPFEVVELKSNMLACADNPGYVLTTGTAGARGISSHSAM